uniref:LRRNT domain-containing protein n=1 Tax=Anas zonorhyncha TaxID=75864 RepID=A0A8B9ZMJ2_9AVES
MLQTQPLSLSPTHLPPPPPPPAAASHPAAPIPELSMARSGFFLGVLLACLACSVQACPPSCHCHGGDLQHVICDNAGLKKIPKVPEQTRLLNLQKNNFPVLPTNGFRDMKKLVSLHLQGSRIKEISTGAFRGLKSLVYLYLTDNQISVIKPGAFDDLSELTYLYLDQNKIPDLSKGILSPLVNLFILHLGSNKIQELKPGVFSGAKDLRWLFLSDNSLTSLVPGALEDVENLAVLHLDKNQLSSYPVNAMSKLRVLEELKLSHNPIEVIPDNAFQSFGRYLQTLNLDNMKLKKVAEGQPHPHGGHVLHARAVPGAVHPRHPCPARLQAAHQEVQEGKPSLSTPWYGLSWRPVTPTTRKLLTSESFLKLLLPVRKHI